MISLITCNTTAIGPSADTLHPLAESLYSEGIDLLCCQSLDPCPQSRTLLADRVTATLGLRCSSFAAGRIGPSEDKTGHGGPARGLAVFTGAHIWVLNSGSFSVGADEDETTVLFALVRKHNVAVLVLTLHLAANLPAQHRQLHDLFGHPLLRDPYGAVVLCTDRSPRLAAKHWSAACALSCWSPLRTSPSLSAVNDRLRFFTSRSSGAMLTLHPATPLPRADSDADRSDSGLAVSRFEVHRPGSNKPNRLAFPLSFREQWLGYKEHRAFA